MAIQGKGLDPEQAFALAMGQNGDKADKPYIGNLRVRMREHNLIRRRKVSVPELGPMTTVHETTIDSLTQEPSTTLDSRSKHIPAPGPTEMFAYSTPIGKYGKQRYEPSISTGGRLPKGEDPLYTVVSPSNSVHSFVHHDVVTDVNRIYLTNTSLLYDRPSSIPEAMQSRGEHDRATNIPRDHCRIFSEHDYNEVSSRSKACVQYKQSSTERIRKQQHLREHHGPKSAERRAFEALPKGWKASDAVQMLEQCEVAALQKQAAQQAARFEIMRKEDVDSLSRELRNLDERAEYLRRTYHSLRAGRRNLHSRICQYLRSPRVAKFNHEPLLKQEEALAELDASIDDWVNKLEHAENRRTRIRQKLLEHVAAAMALPVAGLAGISEGLQIAMGVDHPPVPVNLSTPPRSPVKIPFTPRTQSSSPPPQRVVAQIPSTILEQPVIEEAAAFGLGINQPEEQQGAAGEDNQELSSDIRRAAVESIRIYAGDEVAALLVDVEQQMIRMSRAADRATGLKDSDSNMSEEERKELHRAHSHEILQGGLQTAPSSASLNAVASSSSATNTTKSSSSTSATRTATPTTTEANGSAPGGFLLTNAVFNPQTAVAQ
ncbi:hypothetical protein VM1G_08406 [Cytospora mali]|uniref:Up-regulated during septation protein 1 domain-containing protein n=1 Tax=Cytospora mali TaxID=578113 RepID=A0A194W7Q0_CYTMA|nr:hypothetical protein VM1G_08406 [Valsa mali]